MLTSEERQAIRERVNKAMAGPWEWTPEVVDCDPETGPFGEPSAVWYHTGEFYVNYITKQETDLHGFSVGSDADAEFIAHAREDVPKLLDEVEQWQETVKRLDEIAYSRLEEIEQLRAALEKISGYDIGTFEDDWSEMHNIACRALAGEAV